MDEKIKELLEEYQEIRERTIEFLESIPNEKWTWKPHKLLGSFGMQVRHMTTSQNSYIQGIKRGRIDFSSKEFNRELEVNKKLAIEKLKELDKELNQTIKSLKNHKKSITFVDGVAGTTEVQIEEIIHYLMGHEYYHQGIFTCYGRIAGLGKFLFM